MRFLLWYLVVIGTMQFASGGRKHSPRLINIDPPTFLNSIFYPESLLPKYITFTFHVIKKIAEKFNKSAKIRVSF